MENKTNASRINTNKKVHYISTDAWFLDMKQAAAKISSNNRKIFLDLSPLAQKYKRPAALLVFKHVYKFTALFSKPNRKKETIQLFLIGIPEIVDLLKSLVIGSDLATQPANKMYPEQFCRHVKKLFSQSPGYKVKSFDEHEMAHLGLNLINAVGRGAEKQPRFLIIEAPSPAPNAPVVALVGKGVCFDSGGYNLKPSSSMMSMKGDKTGGAIVVSIMHYFKEQQQGNTTTPYKLIGVIPLVENLISHKAQKVGDVHTAYNGKTVEILNTDAEGRLILADALAYVSKVYKPALTLDFATLTGWAQILHCDTSFVYFTTNDTLANQVTKEGDRAGERSMRLPNWPEYQRFTKSDIADYKNVNFECGRSDGFMASMFLMNFVDNPKRWVHFDVTHTTTKNNMHVVGSAATAIALLQKHDLTFA